MVKVRGLLLCATCAFHGFYKIATLTVQAIAHGTSYWYSFVQALFQAKEIWTGNMALNAEKLIHSVLLCVCLGGFCIVVFDQVKNWYLGKRATIVSYEDEHKVRISRLI